VSGWKDQESGLEGWGWLGAGLGTGGADIYRGWAGFVLVHFIPDLFLM
jgi:hypothetical protein